jgi:hypothetical protein
MGQQPTGLRRIERRLRWGNPAKVERTERIERPMRVDESRTDSSGLIVVGVAGAIGPARSGTLTNFLLEYIFSVGRARRRTERLLQR